MGPRRSVKITTPEKRVQAAPEKAPGKRQKKAPPLKVPSIITISIPSKSKSLDVPDNQRHLDVTTKIALANEVVRAQLLNEPIAERPAPKPEPKKRVRKKAVVSTYFNNPVEQETQLPSIPVKKNIKKDPPVVKRTLTRKRVADSTVEKSKIKRQKLPIQRVEVKKEIETENVEIQIIPFIADSTEENTTVNKPTEDAKIFNPPKKRVLSRRKGLNKGKQDSRPNSPILQTRCTRQVKSQDSIEKSSNTQVIKSPKPLVSKSPKPLVGKSLKPLVGKSPKPPVGKSPKPPVGKSPKPTTETPKTPTGKVTKTPADKSHKTPVRRSPKLRVAKSSKSYSTSQSPKPDACIKFIKKETDTLSVETAGQVGSRKTSISSNSNLSWTRDISSSSTTTCVTVTSNDFVRFNKKLPVIKLTNIDSQVKNYKNNATADHKSSNNDDSSSSDSDSDTSSESSNSNIRSPINYGSPVRVNSLNLSSASHNSIVTRIEDHELNKKDYRQAAQNLLHALKKIDIEFKNWLPEGVIASDLNIIKDKLFDILSSEFRALTHCRNLQEISKSKVVEDALDYDEIVNTNEPNPEIMNHSKENCNSNILEHDRVESNKKDSVECRVQVENKTKNTIDSNKTNIIENNKNKTIESDILINSIDSNKVESNKNNLGENKNVDIPKPTSKIIFTVGNKGLETNKTVTTFERNNNNEQNRGKNNKCNKFENIRIKINRMGTKKVEYNSVEKNAFESNVPNKPLFEHNVVQKKPTLEHSVVQRKPNYEYNVQSKPVNIIASNPEEDDLIRPSTSGIVTNQYNQNIESSKFSDPESESNNSSDNMDFTKDVDVNSFPNSPCYDDDDALSLFAESITGIESSKQNASTVSAPEEKQFEEYVPKPIQKAFISPNYTYCPTRISEQNKNGVVKTICEKQNADSTSICKDKEVNTLPPISTHKEETNQNLEENFPIHTEINTPNEVKRMGLLADTYKLKPKESNIIFKGYCYFNLINKCSNAVFKQPCRYPHLAPSEAEVKSKLVKLSEEFFIKEYLLIRRNHKLMIAYGMYFIGECVRRQLTRMLVEIAYDFVSKKFYFDDTLLVTVIETTLLYLNNVDVSVCEDLLKLKHEDAILCEVFMQVMSSMQNFSRFRSVFLSLTYFMVNNDRTFDVDMAEQILERVCILPFDEPVVKATIQIIRLTNPEIFANSIIDRFEKVISVNQDVLEEYLSVKRGIHFESLARLVANNQPTQVGNQNPVQNTVEPVFSHEEPIFNQVEPIFSHVEPIFSHMKPVFSHVEPVLNHVEPMVLPSVPSLMMQRVDPSQTARQEVREGVPLPPSPDTTHLDLLNKSADEIMVPKITRTIWGFNSPHSAPNAKTANASSSPSNNKQIGHHNWRNRSIFQEMRRGKFTSPRNLMRPPLRPRAPVQAMRNKQYNQRLVTFGGSPIMYPPPEPDY